MYFLGNQTVLSNLRVRSVRAELRCGEGEFRIFSRSGSFVLVNNEVMLLGGFWTDAPIERIEKLMLGT